MVISAQGSTDPSVGNPELHPFKFGIAGGGYSSKIFVISLWIRRRDKHAFRFNISAVELSQLEQRSPNYGRPHVASKKLNYNCYGNKVIDFL